MVVNDEPERRGSQRLQLDPGEHRFEVAIGDELHQRDVQLAPGERRAFEFEAPPGTETDARTRRRAWPWIVGIGAALSAAGVVSFVVVRSRGTSNDPALGRYETLTISF